MFFSLLYSANYNRESSDSLIKNYFYFQYNCSGPPAKCYVPGECWGTSDHLLETQSKEECLVACKETKGCRWFTYHNPTSACVLYKTCDDIYSCTDCVSGEVRCSAPQTTTTRTTTTTTATTTEQTSSSGEFYFYFFNQTSVQTKKKLLLDCPLCTFFFVP